MAWMGDVKQSQILVYERIFCLVLRDRLILSYRPHPIETGLQYADRLTVESLLSKLHSGNRTLGVTSSPVAGTGKFGITHLVVQRAAPTQQFLTDRQ